MVTYIQCREQGCAHLNGQCGQHAFLGKIGHDCAIQTLNIQVRITGQTWRDCNEVDRIRRAVDDDAGDVELPGVLEPIRRVLWNSRETVHAFGSTREKACICEH
eukprot:6209613-Pleurochrysis_carterae.AAC.3